MKEEHTLFLGEFPTFFSVLNSELRTASAGVSVVLQELSLEVLSNALPTSGRNSLAKSHSLSIIHTCCHAQLLQELWL
jgi:hypothetical protein